jgi:hypothetical protein
MYMKTKKSATKAMPAAKKTATKKDPEKLKGRFALDFAAMRGDMLDRSGMKKEEIAAVMADETAETNPALLRLNALTERDRPTLAAPVNAALANWTPLGPLAVPNGQTYGGARVLISGRVTAIAPHPSNGNTIFIGTSRGGVWQTLDGGNTWTALGDNQPSLAIGALGIGISDPDVLYAGTGEGNVQFYSTAYPTSSAPGVYLGVGVLRSADGGITWTHQAAALLANHSFYRIAVDRNNASCLCRDEPGSVPYNRWRHLDRAVRWWIASHQKSH